MDEFRKDDDNEIKNDLHVDKIYTGGAVVREENKIPIWFIKSKNVIYYILGVVEVMLLLRFVFMILGANPRSGFTVFLYSVTDILIAPFSGIFNLVTTGGLVSKSIFDPATIIAMAIYALIAWGLVKLLLIKVSRDGL